MVRSNIAAAFSIPTRQAPETEARNAELREARLAKRKKVSDSLSTSALIADNASAAAK